MLPRTEAIGVGLLVFTLATGGAFLWGKTRERRTADAEWQAKVVEMQLVAQRKFDSATAAFRDQERAWRDRLQEAQDDLARQAAEIAVVRSDLRRTRTERDGLRDQIAAYATGGASAAEDTLPACRHRASTLGALLEDALRVGEASAGDGESCEARIRALRAAWPE